MGRRPEPVRKSVKDTLEDILAGQREAAIHGPAAVIKYLSRVFGGQGNLPLAVRSVAYDRLAEAQAQLQDWEACAVSVGLAIQHLREMETEFPHAYREMLSHLTCFERGIQAHSQLGQFQEALALAEQAVSLDLGAHYAAKRDSLAWASAG
jgi:tetratricopeptide (TPR) repeat protein